MLSAEEIKRFKRQLLLHEVGESGQLALKNAKVLVVGAGGLGNVVTAYLAAAGVGQITIVDHDKVDLSNLQRQVMFTSDDIGLSKSVQLASRLKMLNNETIYTSIDEEFTKDNCIEIVSNQDLIIDCVDQIEVRYLLSDVSVFKNIPLIYGAIHRFEGQVSVFNYKGSGSYRCAFPEKTNLESAPNCEEVGVIGVLPGVIGLYQAMEALKIIASIGKVLTNQILMVDVLQTNHLKIGFERKSRQIDIAKERMRFLIENKGFISKSLKSSELEAFLGANRDVQIIDIQMDLTQIELMGFPVTHMPEYSFVEQIQMVNRNSKVLVYCEKGMKSQWAITVMESFGFKNIYQLSDGVASVIS